MLPTIEELTNLARNVGKIAVENHTIGVPATTKSDQTPLTIADTAINRAVIDWVEKTYPDHVRVIGEEECGGADIADLILLVDPIDGTIPFVMGLPLSTIVLTLLHNLEPVASVIHDPFLNRTWSAVKSLGVETCIEDGFDYKRLENGVSNIEKLSESKIWIGSWNESIDLDPAVKALRAIGAQTIYFPSVAYFGGILASGGIDATVFPGTNAWETAAMQLIVEGAGGLATDIAGDPLQYVWDNGHVKTKPHVMTNGYIHADLIEVVNQSLL